MRALTTCITQRQANLVTILNRSLSSAAASSQKYDVAIVGGGIVGLAVGQKLILDNPNLKYVLVEKENQLAFHQTGHNSGVIHAGVYYKPGSLKARLCVEGLNATYKYCDQYSIPYKRVGKLIVAVNQDEATRLDELYQRGLQNNVPGLKMVNSDEIKQIEPNCVGLKAIYSPNTGIVDWGFVAKHYGKVFQEKGGTIKLGFEVDKFGESSDPNYPFSIEAKNESKVLAKYAIVCAGLHSDKMAIKAGCNQYPKVVPFRGDYLVLKPEKSNMVRGNVYPVPNPKFPFLGVHFTPRMDGSVWLGPNAVLAFKREGYNMFDFSLKDALEEASFRGLRKMVFKNFSYGMGEMYRGLSISATVKELQKFVPSLKLSDVVRGPSGVRAQAIDKDGNLVDDFVFDSGTGKLAKRMLHVRNAPSPAATSSLAIANVIAQEVVNRFDLPKPSTSTRNEL